MSCHVHVSVTCFFDFVVHRYDPKHSNKSMELEGVLEDLSDMVTTLVAKVSDVSAAMGDAANEMAFFASDIGKSKDVVGKLNLSSQAGDGATVNVSQAVQEELARVGGGGLITLQVANSVSSGDAFSGCGSSFQGGGVIVWWSEED